MTDELLDLVDKNDQVIGTVWKSEAHGDPTKIHREVAIAVFNDKEEVLLQRRSMKKRNDPGRWTITAAGHVGKGEDPKIASVREVKEELGLDVKPVFFGKYFMKYKDKESRFFWIYYARVKGKARLRLDKSEVMDARWVDLGNIEEFAQNNDYPIKGESHKILMEMKKSLSFEN